MGKTDLTNKTDLTKSIQTWLDGDERGFTPVFHYYHDKLMQFSGRFMYDEQLTEELVMNVLCKIWAAREKIINISTFNAYIYSAMRNEIVSALRARKTIVVPLDAVASEPRVHSEYEYQAVTGQYKSIVEKLPPRRKQIFLMSIEQGLTYTQISEKLQISINTVQKQASVAYQAIREEVNTEC